MKRIDLVLLLCILTFFFVGNAAGQNEQVIHANGGYAEAYLCGEMGCGGVSAYSSGDSKSPQAYLSYNFFSSFPMGGYITHNGWGVISSDSFTVKSSSARLQVNGFTGQVCTMIPDPYTYTCESENAVMDLEWKQDHRQYMTELINRRQVQFGFTAHIVGRQSNTSAMVSGVILGITVNNGMGSLGIQHNTQITMTKTTDAPLIPTSAEMKADLQEPTARFHGNGPSLKKAEYTFVQIDYPGATATRLWGINDAGAVAGSYVFPNGKGQQAFVMDKGVFTSLEVPGAIRSQARGINNAGQIVGLYTAEDGSIHAFHYSNGVYRTIDHPTLEGDNYGMGIASDGTIVGQVISEYGATSYVLKNGAYSTYSCGPTTYTQFNAIASNGAIVGNCDPDPATYLAIWGTIGNFRMYELPGAFATALSGINASGFMVGSYQDPDLLMHGFTFDGKNAAMLDYPGSTQTHVRALNASGQIVGFFNGGAHGFIASPRSNVKAY